MTATVITPTQAFIYQCAAAANDYCSPPQTSDGLAWEIMQSCLQHLPEEYLVSGSIGVLPSDLRGRYIESDAPRVQELVRRANKVGNHVGATLCGSKGPEGGGFA